MLSGANDEHTTIKDGELGESHREDDMNTKTHDESESLSDIDDQEVIDEFCVLSVRYFLVVMVVCN